MNEVTNTVENNEVANQEERNKLIQRLKRIEGQVRGIQRMIEEEQFCVDILTQIAAARAALDKVGGLILENHTEQCLLKAIDKDRSEQAIEDIMTALKRFIK